MFRRYRLLTPDNGSNPSSADAQAANVGDPQPQAGNTPPEPQAGDGNEPFSLEEAKKLRNEAANLRKRLKAYEEAEAATKAAQQTNEEKLQAERDALQASNEDLAAELLEHRVNQDISKLASKFNFTLSADLIAKLLDWKEIEWDEENGKPLNIEKLLEKLAKNAPELVKQQAGAPGTPALPAMNPGRSSITQPGGNVPGKIPRLDDIQWSR